ncbi:hypothetical protein P7K49_032286, partial [Saguinus oedipus]
MRRKRRRRRKTTSTPSLGRPEKVWRCLRPPKPRLPGGRGPRSHPPQLSLRSRPPLLRDRAWGSLPRQPAPGPRRLLLKWQVPPSARPRRGPGCGPPGEPRAGPGGAAAGPDTHRDDGGALAPLPPVSLSLGLPRRAPAPAAASAASAAPAASLRPRRSGFWPRRSLLSLSPARGSNGARGRGGDSPLPGKYRSPRAPSPGGGAARPGPAWRAAATRPGAERRLLQAASSRRGFCKSHKMARARNLRSEKRRGPGGGGGSSARRARTARPRVPAQTDRPSHTPAHPRAHSLSHTLPRTHTRTHTGPARSPAAAAAPTAAAGTAAAQAAAAAPAPPSRGVRSLSPTWATISSSDGSSLPGYPRR